MERCAPLTLRALSDLRIGKGDFNSMQIFSLRFDGVNDSSERRSSLLRVALRKGLSSNLLREYHFSSSSYAACVFLSDNPLRVVKSTPEILHSRELSCFLAKEERNWRERGKYTRFAARETKDSIKNIRSVCVASSLKNVRLSSLVFLLFFPPVSLAKGGSSWQNCEHGSESFTKAPAL